jgi:hypothetical protein
MAEFIPSEKGVPIRMPSTANLMIDSIDRDNPTLTGMANFFINKNQALLNGFFTRIGATEVVLEWNNPNIITGVNDTFSIIYEPAGANVPATATLGTLGGGFFNVEQALDEIASQLTLALNAVVPAPTFSVALNKGNYFLENDQNAPFTLQASKLQEQLFPSYAGNPLVRYPIGYADLRPYRYIDFTSPQLTYNQDLKDATSSQRPQDVLVRWYFAYADLPPAVDAYGQPILMGYTPFKILRTYQPPKQIKWTPNQPIGQVQFVLYGNDGEQISTSVSSNWLMTLQVSEV